MPLHRPIHIIIADDHALFRTGIKAALLKPDVEEFVLSGEATNGREVIELVKKAPPDIVLMDIMMPEMDGIHATAILKQSYPQVRTIALSYDGTRENVFNMLKAGADGYLLKNTGMAELHYAIRSVFEGIPYFTPTINMHITERLRELTRSGGKDKKKELTKRESEILQLICNGESSKEIAASLYVSKRTVDSFREKIMRKTGVKNMLQLLRYALREKLLKD